MLTSARSAFLHCSRTTSLTSRTAVYGPVRTVVWQGSVGDYRPYADLVAYQVAPRYQGQSANYKAIYLFSGDNPRQHQTVDLYLTGIRYSDISNAYRPVRILGSPWRDIPVLRDWLLTHTTTDPGCVEMNNLCCLDGHCAMRRSDFDLRMSRPIIGGTGGISYAPAGSRPELSLASFSSLHRRNPLGLPMLQNGDRDANCTLDSGPYCACYDDTSCVGLVQPYSTSPNASCAVYVHYRQVYPLGFIPTGKYHNWVTTVIKAPAMTAQQEIFDGGPEGTCPFCGNIGAWDSLPPEGHESGDAAGGGGWWNAGGFYSDNCEGVMDIQDFIFSFPENTMKYSIWGPNSNSVACIAVQTYYTIDDPPGGTAANPGWGTFLP